MKTIIRVQKISIDKPDLGSQAWVNCVLQSSRLGENYEILSTSSRVDNLHRKGDDIVNEVVQIKNPFTGEEKQFTGLEVQLAIASFARKWIMEDLMSKGRASSVDDNNNVVIEDI